MPVTGTKFTLDLPDARLVRREISALITELGTQKPRSASQRAALVRRTLKLLERLARSYEGSGEIEGMPGSPEYNIDRGDDFVGSFLDAYSLGQRNLRIDVLSRAAYMVFRDPIKTRQWVDGAPVAGRWSSPYWAALDSVEGLEAFLELLKTTLDTDTNGAG